MRDRLSFRLGDVSVFSLALLGSVEDYSGTVRQAINLLEFGFSAVLLADHHNAEGTIRQVEVLTGETENQPLSLPGPNQRKSWYDPQHYPTVKYAVATVPPTQIYQPIRPESGTNRPTPAVSAAMLDTIGAGIDRKPSPANQDQGTVPLQVPLAALEPRIPESSTPPKKPLNPELLGTIGAGIDAAPMTIKEPAQSQAERLKNLSPEERAAIAKLLKGTGNPPTPERGES